MTINLEQPAEAAALTSRALSLDSEIKDKKKELEAVKAKLQSMGLAEMENKNLKYIRFGSINGACEISHKTKFEIDNYGKLEFAIEDKRLLLDKIKRKEEIKYEVDSRFKAALIAFITRDYAQHDLPGLLQEMGIVDDKAQKLVLKKLRGDYVKDKQLLESLGFGGELEEELDAIREEKNRELVERYFDPALTDIEELRRAIYLEDQISITLTANNGE